MDEERNPSVRASCHLSPAASASESPEPSRVAVCRRMRGHLAD